MNRFPSLDDIKSSKVAAINKHLFEEKQVKKLKYRNQKVKLDGYLFDSKKEARRYIQLRALQTADEINDLKLQVPFKLSVCTYYADFTYNSKDGFICEDVKGFRNRVYIMKKKLMLSELGIEIKEV
jgi:hypothetical protein